MLVSKISDFKSQTKLTSFTRKDYMAMFKIISATTASRDLKKALTEGIITKKGEHNKTVYQF